jgi:patatin-like phospholipase/acyl hydrolase
VVTKREPGVGDFRVLALDGGGIRGIFTASFVATLEDLSGTPVAESFDLIVGTSTGGIIGLALAFEVPAKEILDLYLVEGKTIFARPRRLGMLRRPKYSNASLTRALRAIFGEKTLDEVRTPVCISSYELTNSYPRIWKDNHSETSLDGGGTPAWKVALATSSAPIYFPGTTVLPGDSHVDGGLFANNPTLIGITEAVHDFHQPLGQIRVLSVGAGERAERIPHQRARRMGVWEWKTAMYEHMLIAQAHIAHEVARRLLEPGRYQRVNVPLEHPYPFDDYEDARTLLEPGAQAARTRFLEIRKKFLFAPAALGRARKSAVHDPMRRRVPDAGPHRLGI